MPRWVSSAGRSQRRIFHQRRSPGAGPRPCASPGAGPVPVPFCWQIPATHIPPAQVFPAQQGKCGLPHPTHVPAEHTVREDPHTPLAQHGPPKSPQHTPDSQEADKPEHVPPPQHCSPCPPQATQYPDEQTLEPLLQTSPSQQRWVSPPHVWQVPAAHTVPAALQMSPAQQGSSTAMPHFTQIPSVGEQPKSLA